MDVNPLNIVEMIRGDDLPGTKIALNIEREGKKRVLEVGLIRAKWEDVNHRRRLFESILTLGVRFLAPLPLLSVRVCISVCVCLLLRPHVCVFWCVYVGVCMLVCGDTGV